MQRKPTQGINWLASYPKSGSTWVRSFLQTYLEGGVCDLDRLEILGFGDSHSLLWQHLSPKPLHSLTLAECTMFRPAALVNLLQLWSCLYRDYEPIVKTHVSCVRMIGIDTMPPAVSRRGVYIIRDPRDVVVSASRYFQESYDDTIERIGNSDLCLGSDTVKQPVRSWSNHVEDWHNNPQFSMMYLRYEDLLARPEQEFTSLLQFLQWSVDEDLVHKSVEAVSFDNLRSREQSEGFVENHSDQDFFKQGRWGAFTEELTEDQIRRIEHDHGDVMVEWGYNLMYDDCKDAVES